MKLTNIKRIYKQIIVGFNDLIISLLALIIALSLRLEKIFIPKEEELIIFILSAIIFVPIFYFKGLYSAIFRYTNIDSIKTILESVAIYSIIFSFIVIFININGIPRSIGIIQPLFFFIFVLISRLLVRYVINKDNLVTIKKRYLIYGTGITAVEASEAISINKQFHLVGFIDNQKELIGKKINNIMIYNFDDLKNIISSKNISDVLIAKKSLGIYKIQKTIKLIENLGIKARILPSISEIYSGEVSVKKHALFELSEILDRKIDLNEDGLYDSIKGKTILVSGAGGSIGGELVRQIIHFQPKKIILLDHSEYSLYKINSEIKNILTKVGHDIDIIPVLDSVCNEDRVDYVLGKYKPSHVYHAAAYKHVPLCEENSISAIKNNFIGTINLADSAIKNQCSNFILISSDKAVRPTNIMGASKRLSEISIQIMSEQNKQNGNIKFSIVRFGNVMNSSGSVIPIFRKQIQMGGPLTVTDKNVTRYFMTIPEAAGLVLEAGVMSTGGETFVLNMGKPIKILDLAKKLIKLSGLTEKNESNPNGDIEIKIIGLSKGEKLHEELLIDHNPKPTSNKNIMKANETFIEIDQYKKIRENIIKFVDQNESEKMITFLKNSIKDLRFL